MHTISDKRLLMLRPKDIIIPLSQPRKNVDPYDLKLLSESISVNGVIEPLSIRKNQNGKYELISGQRRLMAALMAGTRRIPCILHRTDEETAAFYSVIENLQHSRIDFFEEARSVQLIVSNFGLPYCEVARRLGITQSSLSNKLRLLKLDSYLQREITNAGLTELHARSLLRLPEYQREEALNTIISSDMTARQTEDMISEMLCPPKHVNNDTENNFIEDRDKNENEQPVRKIVIGDVRLFTNSLNKLVETLKSASIGVSTKKIENEKYIEYKVRIDKTTIEPGQYKQLKIC